MRDRMCPGKRGAGRERLSGNIGHPMREFGKAGSGIARQKYAFIPFSSLCPTIGGEPVENRGSNYSLIECKTVRRS